MAAAGGGGRRPLHAGGKTVGFIAADHDCPAQLPVADVRLEWYQRGQSGVTQSSGISGLLLIMFEGGCGAEDQCTSGSSTHGCKRMAPNKETDWAYLGGMTEQDDEQADSNGYEILRLINKLIKPESLPGGWAVGNWDKKAEKMRSILSGMIAKGCFGGYAGGYDGNVHGMRSRVKTVKAEDDGAKITEWAIQSNAKLQTMSQTMSQADFCGVNTRSSDLVQVLKKKKPGKNDQVRGRTKIANGVL